MRKRKNPLDDLAVVETWFMAVVYVLNILVEAGYCYVLTQSDYTVHSHPVFFWFYAVSSGVMILLASQLLGCVVRKRALRKRMHLLLWFLFFQLCAFGMDIAYAVLHGELWSDGYVFFALELLLTVTYLRRYLVLRGARSLAESAPEKSVKDGP